MVTAEQIDDIKKRIADLEGFLSIQEKKEFVAAEELKTQAFDFWDNPKSAETHLKKINRQKVWVVAFQEVQSAFDDLSVLFDFFQEGEVDEDEINKSFDSTLLKVADLEFKNMLSGDEDNLSAVMTINPGAGGTESQDWAEMLMRMYIMWGEKNKFKVKELDFQAGDAAGIKSVTLQFDGDFAFGNLKGENGVHRLVRISPFDSNAKRHTSFTSVFVYPLVDESIEIEINPADISWDTFRAGGAGGQGVNKIKQQFV